jgi:hypothetical protein
MNLLGIFRFFIYALGALAWSGPRRKPGGAAPDRLAGHRLMMVSVVFFVAGGHRHASDRAVSRRRDHGRAVIEELPRLEVRRSSKRTRGGLPAVGSRAPGRTRVIQALFRPGLVARRAQAIVAMALRRRSVVEACHFFRQARDRSERTLRRFVKLGRAHVRAGPQVRDSAPRRRRNQALSPP